MVEPAVSAIHLGRGLLFLHVCHVGSVHHLALCHCNAEYYVSRNMIIPVVLLFLSACVVDQGCCDWLQSSSLLLHNKQFGIIYKSIGFSAKKLAQPCVMKQCQPVCPPRCAPMCQRRLCVRHMMTVMFPMITHCNHQHHTTCTAAACAAKCAASSPAIPDDTNASACVAGVSQSGNSSGCDPHSTARPFPTLQHTAARAPVSAYHATGAHGLG